MYVPMVTSVATTRASANSASNFVNSEIVNEMTQNAALAIPTDLLVNFDWYVKG